MAANLSFTYAAMNCGKSTALLQTAYNLSNIGKKVQYYTSALDNRYGYGKITSRIGLSEQAMVIPKDDFSVLNDIITDCQEGNGPYAIFVDECQFLSSNQVDKLGEIVDNYDVKVYCYGLRTDYSGKLFEGSHRLFEVADKLRELNNNCQCGKKATMTIRLVDSTEQVYIGGNDVYQCVCRKCHNEHLRKHK